MSIRPVDLSGMIQRTQDIGNIKHAEDSRPVADQYNIEVRQENRNLIYHTKYRIRNRRTIRNSDTMPGKKGITAIAVMEKEKKHGQPDEDEGSVHIKERRTSFDVKI